MCGRYTLTIDKTHFGARFYIAQATYDWEPAYNAARS
jgi:putative SOS response-associated peptidase YedK